MAALGWFFARAEAQPAPAAPDPAGPLPPVFVAPAAASPGPPAPATAAVLTAPPAAHAISPGLAATISTALPQFQDSAANAAPGPAAADRPRNRIPRLPVVTLPRVTVRERRIRDFTERESYTTKGLEALAVRRYLSDFDRYFLNRFTIPLYGQSQEARAMALYDQDEYINNWRAIYGYDRLPAPNDPPEIPDFSGSPAADPESTAPKNSDWPKPWPRPAP